MKGIMKRAIYCFVALVLQITCGVDPAFPTTISVGEVGDFVGSATSLNGLFSTPAPAGAPVALPTATATSALGGNYDVDWYAFSGLLGASTYFDIDAAGPDLALYLFNGAGSVIAWNDDFENAPGEPGFSNHPFIGNFILPSTGAYFVAVVESGNNAYGGPFLFDFQASSGEGGIGYTLHVSSSSGNVVPEASALLLLSMGIPALILSNRGGERKLNSCGSTVQVWWTTWR